MASSPPRSLADRVDALVGSPTARRRRSPYGSPMNDDERYDAFAALVATRGRRYAGCSLGSFKADSVGARAAVASLRQLAADMPRRLHDGEGGLLLYGPAGVGKDHLLFAMMRSAIVDHGFAVAWWDGLRLLAEVKSAIADGGVETMLSSLVRVPVLGLSDPVPPRDTLTTYEMAVIRDLFERRYSHAAATWVTTNIEETGEANRLLSAPVMSRLRHGALQIHCDWSDYRTSFDAASRSERSSLAAGSA